MIQHRPAFGALDFSSIFSGILPGVSNVITGSSTDLKPRVLVKTPLGNTVIDPWDSSGQTNLPGVSYEIIWGTAQIPPSSALGPRLQTALIIGAIGLGVIFLLK